MRKFLHLASLCVAGAFAYAAVRQGSAALGLWTVGALALAWALEPPERGLDDEGDFEERVEDEGEDETPVEVALSIGEDVTYRLRPFGHAVVRVAPTSCDGAHPPVRLYAAVGRGGEVLGYAHDREVAAGAVAEGLLVMVRASFLPEFEIESERERSE